MESLMLPMTDLEQYKLSSIFAILTILCMCGFLHVICRLFCNSIFFCGDNLFSVDSFGGHPFLHFVIIYT